MSTDLSPSSSSSSYSNCTSHASLYSCKNLFQKHSTPAAASHDSSLPKLSASTPSSSQIENFLSEEQAAIQLYASSASSVVHVFTQWEASSAMGEKQSPDTDHQSDQDNEDAPTSSFTHPMWPSIPPSLTSQESHCGHNFISSLIHHTPAHGMSQSVDLLRSPENHPQESYPNNSFQPYPYSCSPWSSISQHESLPPIQGEGSGVVFDASYRVVTNFHVVSSAVAAVVAGPGGRGTNKRTIPTIPGTPPENTIQTVRIKVAPIGVSRRDAIEYVVVGVDPIRDLALLQPRSDLLVQNRLVERDKQCLQRLRPVKLPSSPSGSGGATRLSSPSDPVQTCGSGAAPHGLLVGQRVFCIGGPFGLTHSLTTGIISAVDRELTSPKLPRPMFHMVQLDAALNPGNSGGALLDSKGHLIGINSAIASPSGAFAGVGFAIPYTTVCNFYKIIVSVLETTNKDTIQADLPNNKITSNCNSPAPPSSSVTRIPLGFPLSTRGTGIHSSSSSALYPGELLVVVPPTLGVSFAPAHVAQRLGIHDGLLVVAVDKYGPAAIAGVRGMTRVNNQLVLGDIVVAFNHQHVYSIVDVFRQLDVLQVGDVVPLTLQDKYQGQRVVDITLQSPSIQNQTKEIRAKL